MQINLIDGENRVVIADNTTMMRTLPSRLQYTPSLWKETESARAVMTAHVHLDFLYNEFMLRRLLYSRHRENYSELLSLSQTMLTVVLETSNIRACQSPNADHIPWIMVLYGLPPAGLLAVELLRRRDQNKPNVPQPNSQTPLGLLTVIPRDSKFSWTQVLQDLAVFNSVLKWMHLPWEGNYELANEAHQSLQRVLKKALLVDDTVIDENTQDFQTDESYEFDAAVAQSDTVNLQQMEAQTEAPLYSLFQDLATDYLNEDVTMGFDVDFWMDLPNAV